MVTAAATSACRSSLFFSSCRARSRLRRSSKRLVVGQLSSCCKRKFFCWRLLGLIPGGTPFSQLNKGVKALWWVSTELVIRQIEKEPSTNSDKSGKEGSGEVTMTAPTPEQKWIDAKDEGFGENPVHSTYARASMQAAKGGGYSCNTCKEVWP